MPTAIIADDEDLLRRDLARMLAQLWPQLVLVRECSDGLAAAEAIDELSPDVAFLDIRMPQLSGLDVARTANGRCHCVFTTAFDEHAIAAFEAGALDYLLKPVKESRLEATLQRLRQRMQESVDRMAPRALDTLVAALVQHQAAKARTPLRWFSATVGNSIKLCSIDEVLYFQSDERYTRIVTPMESMHVRMPLVELIAGLDQDVFWQLNRGLVVRASAIAHAQRDEVGRITLTLKDGAGSFSVSRAYAWRFRGS